MKISFISDTHTKHRQLGKLSGEVLVHCGDFSSRGHPDEFLKFVNWIKECDFEHKIIIAGNHDLGLENKRKKSSEKLMLDAGIIYLNDSGVIINDIKFWGSPIQPTYHSWAFMRDRGEMIQKHWDLIPSDTDVLITHGPPYGILDECQDGKLAGCQNLLATIRKLNIKVHAFGHIHEQHGVVKKEGVIFLNASNLDVNFKLTRAPILINL